MEATNVHRITSEELKQLIDRGDRVVIVDTRDSGGYRAEHIRGAINIVYDPSGDPLEREMRLSILPMDVALVLDCD